MAGAGQPWYMPVLWPVAHVSNAIQKPENEKATPNVSMGKLDFVGHLTSFCAALRSFTLAYLAIFGLYDGFDYPAFGSGNYRSSAISSPGTILFFQSLNRLQNEVGY